ncbi:MAG: Cysteine synthase [Myxococcaceae bacterium]|nr:Cysteine synthase [Myxococcaceae bacterium]
MKRQVASLAELVGNTPLLKLERIGRDTPGVELFAKLEYFNPGGSVKDRAALQMDDPALHDRKLSITTDAGWDMTDRLLKDEGLAVGHSSGAALAGAYQLARELSEQGEKGRVVAVFCDRADRYFYPDQYSNPSNPRAHYLTTAPELWEQTGGKLTHFVAGLGTTGTVMGTGRRLKELNPAIQIVAVEPAEPMHGLEGLKHLGSSIIPPIYDPALHDRKLSITTDAGWDMTDRLLKDEGLAVGHSSGAALAGAYQLARELSEQGEKGRVVAVFCDRADRYFEPGRPAPRFPYR